MKIDKSFLLSNTSSLSGLPIVWYRKGKIHVLFGLKGFPLSPFGLVEKEILEAKEEIGYRFDAFSNGYVFFKTREELVIIGPAREIPLSSQQAHGFAYALGVPVSDWGAFQRGLKEWTPMPLSALLLSSLSLYHVFTGKKVAFEELFPRLSSPSSSENKANSQEFKVESHSSSYSAERQILSFIQNGDIEGLKKWVSSIPSVRPGTTSTSMDTQTKNLFVTTVTLVSRCAISAGLDMDLALGISDSYLQRVEPLSHDAIIALQYQMLMDYATRVHQLGDGGPLSKKVASYVQAHWSEAIRLQDLASSFSMSVPSLCAKFKKETGQGVTHFILKMKIKEAERELIESDRSISEIAFYLGFSSPAHFSKDFSALNSMSPSEYRKKNSNASLSPRRVA